MSDSTIATGLSPLPVSWYCDPKILELEMKHVFAAGPGYVGHELMVPNVGDYQTLEWMDHAKMLIRNDNGVEMLSNICRHRQAIMLEGKGNTKQIVCPLHRWTFGMDGKLVGAPHFPENPCLDLGKTPLSSWNGLLFSGQRNPVDDLANMTVAHDFDFSGMVLDRIQIDEYDFNWKTFLEVYLEDYHVPPCHPGLNSFVNCDDLTWEYGEWHSVQTVGANYAKQKAATPVYNQWREHILKYEQGKMSKYGAVWVVYYPNVMLEWYPHVLVVSTLIPRGVHQCTNVVEFYYPEEIAHFERELIEAEKEAYNETAVEDEEICLRMEAGRKALYQAGISESGPYQSPTEDGMSHFHQFMLEKIGPHL